MDIQNIKANNKKFLLIGWDAADWKAIHPLMDQGLMPNLEKMIEEGTMGKLATLDPPLSPMLWTSIATGKRPYKHGILGFTEPRADGKGIQPVQNTSRKCKAIWNIMTQLDKTSNVIGWWPSNPAEPIKGTMLSNFYQKAQFPEKGKDFDKWPLMRGTVHPKNMADTYAKLRFHPYELTAAHMQAFMPKGAKVDQSNKKMRHYMNSLRKIIADCTTIHNAATYMMENEPWDFMAVYYDAIDHFGHGFMKYHPPKRKHIPQDLYDAFHYVNIAGYRYHDMMLGRLLELAGEDTTVMLISDHGFHPDELRPEGLPKYPAAAALEHSPFGIFVCKGPGIKKDHQLFGASLIDITPTILQIYDLPVADDMDGKILSDIFVDQKEIPSIESWELIEGECGMHPEEVRKDPFVDQEALDQLVELGYIDKPDENAEKAIKKTMNEINFWLAKSYIDGNMDEEAIPLLEDLFMENNDQTRYGFLLVNTYRKLDRQDDAHRVLSILKAGNQLKGPNVMVLEAKIHTSNGEYQKAIDLLLKAEAKVQNNPDLYLHLAHTYLNSKDYPSAQRAYDKAIELDSQNSKAFFGKASAYFHSGQYENAAINFVETIALVYNQPLAHYFLGECLNKLGDHEGAARAYEASLKLNDNVQKARHKLSLTHDIHLDNPEISEELKTELLAKTQKEIVIVSGLPRSGTSLMMQMLEVGGLEAFTDKKRIPDANNPKGYYEHEDIKKLAKDKLILNEIEETQVVKIIAQLLFNLPLIFRYKIVFMTREMDEVLQSQQKMLQRLSEKEKVNANRQKNKLKQSFEKTLQKIQAWAAQMPNVEICYVDYYDAVHHPIQVAKKVQEFLKGKDLDEAKMIRAVDKSLYREKVAENIEEK